MYHKSTYILITNFTLKYTGKYKGINVQYGAVVVIKVTGKILIKYNIICRYILCLLEIKKYSFIQNSTRYLLIGSVTANTKAGLKLHLLEALSHEL